MFQRINKLDNGKLKIFAPAKINLGLHILNKRPDTYHNIDSLVVFADYGDELEYVPSDRFQLIVTGEFADSIGIAPKQNIVYKTAEVLSEKFGIIISGTITLTKNIPVAAGIGGGSADSAACLIILSYALNLPDEKLPQLALQLGADVPVCLLSKPAYMSGLGEILQPAEIPNLHIVLINPLAKLPTQIVFGLGISVSSGELPKFSSGDFFLYLKSTSNDLTSNAIKLCPIIEAILHNILQTNCVYSSMSGSGATCFGVYNSKSEAIKASEHLAKIYPDFWIKYVTTTS